MILKSGCAACPAARDAKHYEPRTESVSNGSGALKSLTDEVEHRPLLMLGAAGVGFLAGLTNQR